MRNLRLRDALGLVTIATTLLAGCAGGAGGSGAKDPGMVAADQEANPIAREKALRAGFAGVQAGEVDHKDWRERTKSVAWLASNPARTRLVALELLLEDDPTDTENMIALMLPREPAWPVIDWICETSSSRGWVSVTPSLVRSWARPVIEPTDDDRPERAAIVSLYPNRQVVDVVFDVFATPADESLLEQRRRTDAWALLARIDPSLTRTRELLATLAPRDDDQLVAALTAGAEDLRAVPQTTEQLDWLTAMREQESLWEHSAAAVRHLDPEQLDRFELRHASAARWAAQHRPQWMVATRAELLSELNDRLGGRRTFQRYSGYADGQAPDERFERNESKLSWGDALLVLIADEVIADPAVIAALFEQAAADQRDTSTEYGGVIDADGDGFRAISYPPRPSQRLGDNRFVASQDLLDASVGSLFHYHFHASRTSMREYAGPGQGDDAYARVLGRSCIVFTTLGKDSMNADYYQPDGVVIDLGEIRRP